MILPNAAVFAASTLSASSTVGASIACSPSVFLAVTSCNFAFLFSVVKLLSALIALVSSSAAVANSALAACLISAKLTLGPTCTPSLNFEARFPGLPFI